MKNKKFGLLSVFLVIVIVGIVVYYTSRPPQQQKLLPQTFAQLPERPKLIAELHNGPRIESVSFSPADPFLIAFSDEYGTIRLWNRNNTKEPIRILSHPGLSATIGFSPTGELLASLGSGKLILWDVATGMKLNSLDGIDGQFAFSPDGNFLAIPRMRITLWDIRDPDNIKDIEFLPSEPPRGIHNWGTRAVEFSPNGKWIAVAHNNGTVNVWDFKSKQIVKTLKTTSLDIDFLKFSPNTRYMCVGGRENGGNNLTKGYIMWELPSWKRHGEVQRGNIDNLVFHPNGKVCVSANDQSFSGRGVEIWSMENGAPITSLPTQARDASFSPDGKILVTGGWDGVIQLWELTAQQLETYIPSTDQLHILYYVPKNAEPAPNVVHKIDESIREAQDFYADEMERHGFGRKTFSFETDDNGKAKVYLMNGNQPIDPERSNDIWLIIAELEFSSIDIKRLYADHDETFCYSSNDGYTTKDNVWKGEIKGIIPGKSNTVNVKSLDRESVAYALRGVFGLPYIYSTYKKQNALRHLISRINDKMPWGKKWANLSKCDAEWLDKSRFFNPNQPFFDRPPKMDMRVSVQNDSDMRHFIFDVVDDNGIQQVQLFVPIDIKNQRWRKKFHDCKTLNGKDKATVAFEISDPKIYTVVLRMIDMHGNIASREFGIKEKTDEE